MNAQPTPLKWATFWGLLLTCVAYSNHFHNAFQFDDSHTVVDNVFIRSWRNVPRFFVDATTFSSLPTNQTWRPLVSTSLAVDYALGGIDEPFWFHVSTFGWHLILFFCILHVGRALFGQAATSTATAWWALVAAVLFAVHPAGAETVNYIVQRADLYATLAVVGGLGVYQRFVRLRPWHLYLLPVALGIMAKASAAVFGAILPIYIFFFEHDARPGALWQTFKRSAADTAACLAMLLVAQRMSSAALVPSNLSAVAYRGIQPFVWLRYVRSFFLPLWLTADTDLAPMLRWHEPRVLLGCCFCLLLAAAMVFAAQQRRYRPIAFGLAWFVCAQAPTSWFVLAEVENDHRMFMSFVGLSWAAAWTARCVWPRQPTGQRCAAGVIVAILVMCVVGTRQRNGVWRTQESLFADVVAKCPHNGRGLMNYGLTQLAKGNAHEALEYFNRAAQWTPNYSTLAINFAITYDLLGAQAAAEGHFHRALLLSLRDARPHYYYARWLCKRLRPAEAIRHLYTAIELNDVWMPPRHLLMEALEAQKNFNDLHRVAHDTLRFDPYDKTALAFVSTMSYDAKP